MAKSSMKARETKRAKTVEKYDQQRKSCRNCRVMLVRFVCSDVAV